MIENTNHPGYFINQWLQENSLSQKYLAAALNFQEPFISKIINGHSHVSPKIALKLERVTSIPATTWMAYQTDWYLARARMQVQ